MKQWVFNKQYNHGHNLVDFVSKKNKLDVKPHNPDQDAFF